MAAAKKKMQECDFDFQVPQINFALESHVRVCLSAWSAMMHTLKVNEKESIEPSALGRQPQDNLVEVECFSQLSDCPFL